MKKLIYVSIVFLFSFTSIYAQDIVTKTNGDDLSVKILEVTQTEIKYKRFDNLDGPTFTLPINEILIIRYENGSKEVFNQQSKADLKEKKVLPEGIRPDMLYKELKTVYNYQMYTPSYSDPHNPFVSGLASFFIPGLGQMITGETGRGFGYLGGYILSGVVYGIGAGLVLNSVDPYYGSVNSSTLGTGSFMVIAGLVGLVTVNISSIVDAVKVAKVRNMYMQDLRSVSSLDIRLSPYIETASFHNNGMSVPVGLSLKVSF